MQPFTEVSGPAAPFMRPNVDTDVIIRVERQTSMPRGELGPYAFEMLRYNSDGSDNPDFILNKQPFRHAPILIAGRNFGCGSSREGAVWSLMAKGFRVVIAESFGDIFYGNCFQNGMLPVVLDGATVERLAQVAESAAPFRVDLQTCTVVPPNEAAIRFDIDSQRREALLDGLDEITRTLRNEPEISAWQQRDRVERPWIWTSAGALNKPEG